MASSGTEFEFAKINLLHFGKMSIRPWIGFTAFIVGPYGHGWPARSGNAAELRLCGVIPDLRQESNVGKNHGAFGETRTLRVAVLKTAAYTNSATSARLPEVTMAEGVGFEPTVNVTPTSS